MAERRQRGLVPSRRPSPVELEPPLIMGDIVRLKRASGPYRMMVVDAMPDEAEVTVGYRMMIGARRVVREWKVQRSDLRRVPNALSW